MAELSAADWALKQVEAVREEPAKRLELLERTYHGPTGQAPHHLPFRRAAMAFMRWQLARDVLAPLHATPAGSPWWRAVNERLLRDGCEAVARSGGRGGAPSSPAIPLWMSFVADPCGRTWYRAHNASIVAAYLENRDLAEQENAAERFFLNVVLLRLLYAHALVSAPRLALGPLAGIGPMLGDPRLAVTGIFLSLSRIVPDRYPLQRDVHEYIAEENPFGQMLDYGIIQPRLQRPLRMVCGGAMANLGYSAWCVMEAPCTHGLSSTGMCGNWRGQRESSAHFGASSQFATK